MLHLRLATILFFCTMHAQSPAEAQNLFFNANELYKNGLTDQAYQLYLKIEHPTPAVHFNLGNCAYRQGKYGMALAHWQRAEWNWGLSDHEMLAKNKALAQEKLHVAQQQEEEPTILTILESGITATWRTLLTYARTIRLLYLQLFFLFLWILLFSLHVVKRSPKIPRICAIFCCSLVGILMGLKGIAAAQNKGIIIKTPAIIMSGPQKSGFATLGRLNEGQEADILGESGDFYKIQTNHTTGWIDKKVVEKL